MRPARGPELVREIFFRVWGTLVPMTDTTEPPTTQEPPAPALLDMAVDEIAERVTILLATDEKFRAALCVALTARAPGQRDEAQRAALLSVATLEPETVEAYRAGALELEALRAREKQASESRTPGATFAQRAPVFGR